MNDEVNSVACRHIAGKPPRARLQTEILRAAETRI
jgi:hypothetical protein